MKYKIIGTLSILSSLFFGVIPFIMIFFVIPRLASLYAESGDTLFIQRAYLFAGIALIPSLGNLFIGVKLFSTNRASYLKIAIAILLLTFLLGGYLVSYMMLQIIQPIYALTFNNPI